MSFESIELAITKISNDNLLVPLEKICEVYLTGNNSSIRYTHFLAAVTNLLDELANPILLFLHQDEDVIVNHSDSQTMVRLNMLRQVYGLNLRSAAEAMSRPFAFNTFASSGKKNDTNFYYHITRKDGTSISFECIFDEGVRLATQMLESLRVKYSKGNNEINIESVEKFIEVTENFVNTLKIGMEAEKEVAISYDQQKGINER